MHVSKNYKSDTLLSPCLTPSLIKPNNNRINSLVWFSMILALVTLKVHNSFRWTLKTIKTTIDHLSPLSSEEIQQWKIQRKNHREISISKTCAQLQNINYQWNEFMFTMASLTKMYCLVHATWCLNYHCIQWQLNLNLLSNQMNIN